MKNKRQAFAAIFLALFFLFSSGALISAAHKGKLEEVTGLDGSTQEQKAALDTWVGSYQFIEATPHIAAPDVSDTWTYTIDIYREAGEYYADLDFTGHMLWIEGGARVEGDEKRIELIFEQYAPECTNSVMQVFEKGEVLLSFENEGNKILTYWEKMQPALYQNEVCGMEYFKKINSNILGV